MEKFIEVYDNALSQDECESIVNWFEESEHIHQVGQCGEHEVRKDIKDSTDICIRMDEPWLPCEIIVPALSKSIMDYCNRYPMLNDISQFGNDMVYNIQRYYPNQGFFKEHCEQFCKAYSRVLAWTLYLNDVEDGGETYYTYYDLKVKAREGRLVIFPAYWTHAHKGIVSKTETKYIATGWFSFL
jgi:hypothetical protein